MAQRHVALRGDDCPCVPDGRAPIQKMFAAVFTSVAEWTCTVFAVSREVPVGEASGTHVGWTLRNTRDVRCAKENRDQVPRMSRGDRRGHASIAPLVPEHVLAGGAP